MVTELPALIHSLPGDTVPPPEGLTAMVRWYCVVYEALMVQVVCEGVNVPLEAVWPQPVNDENTY